MLVGVSRYLDRHQIEFLMTAAVRICRQLTGVPLVPVRVRLSHHRHRAPSEFVEFFGDHIIFDAAVDEVAFEKPIKHMPIVNADPYLSKLLIACCEEAHPCQPTNRGSFRSRVENSIISLLPHGKAKASEISCRLGVSRRTFARLLSLEGVTFSDVLEGLRSDLAERYLADGTLSISKIAWLLGYHTRIQALDRQVPQRGAFPYRPLILHWRGLDSDRLDLRRRRAWAQRTGRTGFPMY